MVVAAAILVGKGRGIGLDFTHRIVANEGVPSRSLRLESLSRALEKVLVP